MLLPGIVIYLILITCSADSTHQDSSLNETLINDNSTNLTTESSNITSPDGTSNVSKINEEEPSKAPTEANDHDIEITGHMTPSPISLATDSSEASPEHNSTTEIDRFNDTSEITTIEMIEVESACSSNPCRNNGSCVEDDVVPSLFSCVCPSGYTGIRCGTVDRCRTDDQGQLCKNGACVYSKDGLLRSCQCFNDMHWDEANKECRDPEPPCFPNPCMNDGICSDEDGISQCDCLPGYRGKNCSVLFKCGKCQNGTCVLNDEQTMKFCKCDNGLYWNEKHETCEVMTSPCNSNPCLNGGICDAVSDTEFNCSCQMDFSGKNCQITDKCDEDPDCGHGMCVLSDDKKYRSCHCREGFYLQEQPHTCKEITNMCQPNPCLNDGICTLVSANIFNCTCSRGYVGETCDVRDLCEMDGGNAYCGNGICGNNNDLGVYFCTCNEGEYFQYTQRKCVELDMCPIIRCESIETCVMGECLCKELYKRDNSTQCKSDFCSSNPCPASEMICKEGTGRSDYKCYCPEGLAFNGTHCKDVFCTFPELNQCNQYCSIKEDGYKCSCAEDFELKKDNHTCSYVGNITCTNKTCDNGFCTKEDGMEEICICPPGYAERDGVCKDICNLGVLSPGVCPSNECESTTKGGFRCKCEGKFAFSEDKTTCMVRNICQENEIGWKTCRERNAECIGDFESMNGYKCICPKGQVVTEGGVCRDICSLENNQRQCSIKGATCDLDDKGRMICKCPPYFRANERDGKCTRPAEFSYLVTLPLDKSTYLDQKRQKRSLYSTVDYRKISSDVAVTIREMFTSFTHGNVLSCKVTSEYILCKIELQFTRESESDLKRLETEDICLGSGISNACLLPPSLVLVKNKIYGNVQIQPTNPCDEDIKNEVCGLETTCISSLSLKSFNCSCKPGFLSRRKNYPFGDTRSLIETCSDIDECVEGNPCPANSNCKNVIGSYTCSCKAGYRDKSGVSGINTQKCVEVCRPNPCTHGRCSRRGDQEFDCRCDAGYAGTFCNLQDENFKSAKINTIIVGVVLGGALLVSFIVFAAYISKLRKQKMFEDSGHMFSSNTEMTERRRGVGGAVNNAFRRE